jgi:hypothetical protein
VALLLAGAASLSWTPFGKALVERLRRPANPADPAVAADVVEELQALRREVAELGERLDFTERLLAQQREQALPRE